MSRLMVGLVALLLLSAQGLPPGFARIELQSAGARGTRIAAYVKRPDGRQLTSAVVMLHGCGGLFSPKGNLLAREVDWADRLVAEGHAIIMPDSFNPRGHRQICTLGAGQRPVAPRDRAHDAVAAIDWMARQPGIDPARIAIIGWSNGGSTVLWAADRAFKPAGTDIKAAIAFYPGCRPPAQSPGWAPRVPLAILIGDADDWTPAEHCRALARKHPAIRLVEYPGAVHGFDAPNSPLRVRTDVGISLRGDGTARVGTDPAARAASIEEVRRLLSEAFKRQ